MGADTEVIEKMRVFGQIAARALARRATPSRPE